MSLSQDDPYDTPFDDGVFELIASFEAERLSQPYSSQTDDNYPLWACRVKDLLVIANRWGVVSGEGVRPVIDDTAPDKNVAEARLEKWKARDAGARIIIYQMLSPEYRNTSHAFGRASAKELWDNIRHEHVEAGKGLKAVRVYRRMHARKYQEGTSLAQFAEGFVMDNMLLQEYGTGMDDKMLALAIIQALP